MTARRNLEWSDGAAGPLLAAGRNWRARAACKDADPDLFFPMPGDEGAERQAKAVCAGCRVRPECLDWALTHGVSGVWGGLSEDERRPLNRPAVRIPAPVERKTKRCPSCDTPKSTDKFFRNSARYDGLDSNCKDCRSGARKARAAA